jgi:hypothetical protein
MLGLVFPIELYISCHREVYILIKLQSYKKISLRIYMGVISILGFSAAIMSVLKSAGVINK